MCIILLLWHCIGSSKHFLCISGEINPTIRRIPRPKCTRGGPVSPPVGAIHHQSSRPLKGVARSPDTEAGRGFVMRVMFCRVHYINNIYVLNFIEFYLFYFILFYFTLPYLTLPYLTLPYLTLPYLTLPYLTLPYLTLPYCKAEMYNSF